MDSSYQAINDLTCFTDRQRSVAAHIKRLGEELLIADADFRDAFMQDPLTASRQAGLRIDADTLEYIRGQLAVNPVFWSFRTSQDAPAGAPSGFQIYYRHKRLTDIEYWRWGRYLGESGTRYQKWLVRQEKRMRLEFGEPPQPFMALHPFAIELADGCSVGCWFCGVSAEKLAGLFPYTQENAALFRGALTALRDIFGRFAQGGGLYAATEPFDNPDYAKFMQDCYEILGKMPQTTTAIAHKNIDKTRDYLAFADAEKCVNNRFSVLSLPLLHRLHAAFTPEELLHVSLVVRSATTLMQTIVNAGNTVGKKKQTRSRSGQRVDINEEEQTTIACVSGFMINMVKRSIQLISPCRTSERWPKGYRIYDEVRFDDADDFRSQLMRMMERNMPECPAENQRARFHPGVEYARLPMGFRVTSPYYRSTVEKPFHMGWLGDLVHEGRYTANELVRICIEKGLSETEARDALQCLFDAGLLDDEPIAVPVVESAPRVAMA